VSIARRESPHKFGFGLKPVIEFALNRPSLRVKNAMGTLFDFSKRRSAVQR
jgi:hypothetical protein